MKHVIEGVMSNLFVWDGQQLITPPLDQLWRQRTDTRFAVRNTTEAWIGREG